MPKQNRVNNSQRKPQEAKDDLRLKMLEYLANPENKAIDRLTLLNIKEKGRDKPTEGL